MKEVLLAIFAAIDEVNAMRPPEDRLAKVPETRLAGPGGKLDSLGLVNLIVAVESNLEQATGVTVELADTRALGEAQSPFRTVGTLAEYIVRLVGEKQRGGA